MALYAPARQPAVPPCPTLRSPGVGRCVTGVGSPVSGGMFSGYRFKDRCAEAIRLADAYAPPVKGRRGMAGYRAGTISQKPVITSDVVPAATG